MSRKGTALPGLVMFDRPTRHPSLDDIRGYGRTRYNPNPRGIVGAGYGRGPPVQQQLSVPVPQQQQQQPLDRAVAYGGVGAGAGSGDSANFAADALKLPPLLPGERGAAAGLNRQLREAALDYTKCLHPQSRICENLRQQFC